MTRELEVLRIGDLDLNDGVNFTKKDGWSWGVYANERDQRRRLRGAATWSPSRRDGWVEMGGPIEVTPSDTGNAEELRAHLRRLQAELAKPENIITARPKGNLGVVTMKVVGDPADVPDDLRFTVSQMPIIQLHLWREPLTRLPRTTIGPQSISAPCAIDLSAMKGDFPTTLDTIFSVDETDDLAALYVAYVPPEYVAWALDPTNWSIEAEDLIWDGNWNGNAYPAGQAGHLNQDDNASPASDAPWDWRSPGSNDNFVWFGQGGSGSTFAVSSAFDTAGFPQGPHLVVARVMNTVANAVMSTGLTPDVAIPAISGGVWQLLELGDCVLPATTVRIGLDSPLSLAISGTTPGSPGLDRLFMLPTRWGSWSWKRAAGGVFTVERDGDTLWCDDAVNLSEVIGSGIEAQGGALLVVTQNTGDTPGGLQTIDFTCSYEPRLTLW